MLKSSGGRVQRGKRTRGAPCACIRSRDSGPYMAMGEPPIRAVKRVYSSLLIDAACSRVAASSNTTRLG